MANAVQVPSREVCSAHKKFDAPYSEDGYQQSNKSTNIFDHSKLLNENVRCGEGNCWSWTLVAGGCYSVALGNLFAWPLAECSTSSSTLKRLSLTNENLIILTLVFYIGVGVGAIAGYNLSDRLGQKLCLLLVAPCAFFCWFGPIALLDWPVICMARFLGGVWAGAAMAIVTTYIPECLDSDRVDVSSTTFTFWFIFGCFLDFISAYVLDFEGLLIFLGLFQLFLFAVTICMSESPYHYLRKGDNKRAAVCFKRLNIQRVFEVRNKTRTFPFVCEKLSLESFFILLVTNSLQMGMYSLISTFLLLDILLDYPNLLIHGNLPLMFVIGAFGGVLSLCLTATTRRPVFTLSACLISVTLIIISGCLYCLNLNELFFACAILLGLYIVLIVYFFGIYAPCIAYQSELLAHRKQLSNALASWTIIFPVLFSCAIITTFFFVRDNVSASVCFLWNSSLFYLGTLLFCFFTRGKNGNKQDEEKSLILEAEHLNLVSRTPFMSHKSQNRKLYLKKIGKNPHDATHIHEKERRQLEDTHRVSDKKTRNKCIYIKKNGVPKIDSSSINRLSAESSFTAVINDEGHRKKSRRRTRLNSYHGDSSTVCADDDRTLKNSVKRSKHIRTKSGGKIKPCECKQPPCVACVKAHTFHEKDTKGEKSKREVGPKGTHILTTTLLNKQLEIGKELNFKSKALSPHLKTVRANVNRCRLYGRHCHDETESRSSKSNENLVLRPKKSLKDPHNYLNIRDAQISPIKARTTNSMDIAKLLNSGDGDPEKHTLLAIASRRPSGVKSKVINGKSEGGEEFGRTLTILKGSKPLVELTIASSKLCDKYGLDSPSSELGSPRDSSQAREAQAPDQLRDSEAQDNQMKTSKENSEIFRSHCSEQKPNIEVSESPVAVVDSQSRSVTDPSSALEWNQASKEEQLLRPRTDYTGDVRPGLKSDNSEHEGKKCRGHSDVQDCCLNNSPGKPTSGQPLDKFNKELKSRQENRKPLNTLKDVGTLPEPIKVFYGYQRKSRSEKRQADEDPLSKVRELSQHLGLKPSPRAVKETSCAQDSWSVKRDALNKTAHELCTTLLELNANQKPKLKVTQTGDHCQSLTRSPGYWKLDSDWEFFERTFTHKSNLAVHVAPERESSSKRLEAGRCTREEKEKKMLPKRYPNHCVVRTCSDEEDLNNYTTDLTHDHDLKTQADELDHFGSSSPLVKSVTYTSCCQRVKNRDWGVILSQEESSDEEVKSVKRESKLGRALNDFFHQNSVQKDLMGLVEREDSRLEHMEKDDRLPQRESNNKSSGPPQTDLEKLKEWMKTVRRSKPISTGSSSTKSSLRDLARCTEKDRKAQSQSLFHEEAACCGGKNVSNPSSKWYSRLKEYCEALNGNPLRAEFNQKQTDRNFSGRIEKAGDDADTEPVSECRSNKMLSPSSVGTSIDFHKFYLENNKKELKNRQRKEATKRSTEEPEEKPGKAKMPNSRHRKNKCDYDFPQGRARSFLWRTKRQARTSNTLELSFSKGRITYCSCCGVPRSLCPKDDGTKAENDAQLSNTNFLSPDEDPKGPINSSGPSTSKKKNSEVSRDTGIRVERRKSVLWKKFQLGLLHGPGSGSRRKWPKSQPTDDNGASKHESDNNEGDTTSGVDIGLIFKH